MQIDIINFNLDHFCFLQMDFHFWQIMDTDDDEEAEHECCICTTNFSTVNRHLCCEDNTHKVCSDCVNNTIINGIHTIRHSTCDNLSTNGIKCLFCDSVITVQQIAAFNAPYIPELLTQLMDAYVHYGQARAVRQAAVAALAAQQNPLQHYCAQAERLLHSYCPNCTIEWCTFDGCSALTCGYCMCSFCAHCNHMEQDFRKLHSHVRNCGLNPTPTYLHTPTPIYKQARSDRLVEAMNQYVQNTVPANMRAQVLETVQTRLVELLIE